MVTIEAEYKVKNEENVKETKFKLPELKTITNFFLKLWHNRGILSGISLLLLLVFDIAFTIAEVYTLVPLIFQIMVILMTFTIVIGLTYLAELLVVTLKATLVKIFA